ncbi:fimbria/pilus periplasmic chaperone [Klebsiella aerogenes]
MKTDMNSDHQPYRNSVRIALCLTALMAAQQASAAIALDRTRVIFNGDEQSVTLAVSNQNKELPYLAQAWVEDENGNKIESPLAALPPLQRVEPGAKSQVKVQATSGIHMLARDRESLFYFNLREIPPKSTKPNTLQIALQTRVKLFYRPESIALTRADQATPYQQKITLSHQGDKYVVNNPTPYFVTIASAAPSLQVDGLKSFTPMMVAPKSSAALNVSASSLGTSPVLTYINDYGGRPKLLFGCAGTTCSVKGSKAG